MEEFDKLPDSFIMAEIFERLDMPEVHTMRSLSTLFREFLSRPEFMECYTRRTWRAIWSFTHYFTTAEVPHYGMLKGVRVEDKKTISFNLDIILDGWLDELDRIELLTAHGNLFVFLVRPKIFFLVVNPFLGDVYYIDCPEPLFTAESFRRNHHIEIVPSLDDFEITFIQIVDGIPHHYVVCLERPEWAHVLGVLAKDKVDIGSGRHAIMIANDNMYKVGIENGENQPVFITREMPRVNSIQETYEQIDDLLLEDDPLPGWMPRWHTKIYQGWAMVYQTHYKVERPEISRLQQIFLLKLRENMTGYDLIANFPRGDLFIEHPLESLFGTGYEILEVSTRELHGSLHVAFLLNDEDNFPEDITTILFQFDIQHRKWKKTIPDDFEAHEIDCLVFNSDLLFELKNTDIVLKPQRVVVTQIEQDEYEKFYKDQLKVIQDERKTIEVQFDKLAEQAYSPVDSKKRDDEFEKMKEFHEEKDKLMKLHVKKLADMQSRHSKEEIKSEERFNAKLTNLMDPERREDIIQVHEEKNANMKTLHRKEEILLEKGFNAALTQFMNPKERVDKFNEMKEFEEEREKLVELHQRKTAEMKNRHLEEEMKLDDEFAVELTQLMDKVVEIFGFQGMI